MRRYPRRNGVFGEITQADIDNMTKVDMFGVRYWKPEIAQVIISSLPGHCVTGYQSPDTANNVYSASLADDNALECQGAISPAETWYNEKVSAGLNTMASVGLAIPDVSLQKYLFTVGDNLEILKSMSQLSPVLAVSPTVAANLNKLAQTAEAAAATTAQAGLGVRNWPLTIGLLVAAGGLLYVGFRGQRRKY